MRTVIVIPMLVVLMADTWTSAQATRSATAPATARPEVTITTSVEDKQQMIVATVTLGGKPLKDAQVSFSVRRLFGLLKVGQDATLEDGTAAVSFPSGLPGGEDGKLSVVAAIVGPQQYAGAIGEAVLSGAAIIHSDSQASERALWAPRAPRTLIATLWISMGVVWGTYLYVALQIFHFTRRTQR